MATSPVPDDRLRQQFEELLSLSTTDPQATLLKDLLGSVFRLQEQRLDMLDPKIIHFKYFFTRKLFFARESHACAVFPGGYGTQDETFEFLTLLQTGKNNPHPIVLVDLPGGTYWQRWGQFVRDNMLAAKLIAPEDLGLRSEE